MQNKSLDRTSLFIYIHLESFGSTTQRDNKSHFIQTLSRGPRVCQIIIYLYISLRFPSFNIFTIFLLGAYVRLLFLKKKVHRNFLLRSEFRIAY